MEEMNVLFRFFGNCMKSIEIDGNYQPNKTYMSLTTYLVREYCSPSENYSLLHLKISNYKNIDPLFSNFYPVLKNIQILELSKVNLSDKFIDILNKCNEIEEIKIKRCYTSNLNLTKILFNTITRRENQKLKKLFIRGNINIKANEFINNIDHAPNLEELTFMSEFDNELDAIYDVVNISHLKALTVLRLDFQDKPITDFVQDLISNDIKLQEFVICRAELIDDIYSQLANFTSLKILGYSDLVLPINVNLESALYSNLTSLESIHFHRANVNVQRIQFILQNSVKLYTILLEDILYFPFPLNKYRDLKLVAQSKNFSEPIVILLLKGLYRNTGDIRQMKNQWIHVLRFPTRSLKYIN